MIKPDLIHEPPRQGTSPVSRSAGVAAAATKTLPPRIKWLAGVIAILVLCFAGPLFSWSQFALHSDLYSHVLLVPFITLYLIWLKRSNLDLDSTPDRRLALVPFLSAVAIFVPGRFQPKSSWHFVEDYLALNIGAFYLFLVAACCLLLGKRTLRAIVFPLAFLIFMVPFPDLMRRGLESFLQHGSAETAFWMIDLSGMPVLRHGTQFQLPGFSMAVAPQCSGIHSSIVLFLSSLLAGHLLLRTSAAKGLLFLAILPLALLRNGFRIFTLAQLCVRVNPDWINSDLHHRGGPIFFALSLIPFLLLLFLLRKWERRKKSTQGVICAN